MAEILDSGGAHHGRGRPHGRVCVGFTPGRGGGPGRDLFDVEGFGADYAYTVDGGDVGELEYQNFNAAAAVFTVHGFSVHRAAPRG